MIVVQHCGCGTVYVCPGDVPPAQLACPVCGTPCGASPFGRFEFLDARPPELPEAVRK